jgi:uncharacterized protein (TIGR03790 family)
MLAGIIFPCLVSAATPNIYRPAPALSANDIAIIVNDEDPESRLIGGYYQQQRRIPLEQVIHIRFSPNRIALSQTEFEKLEQQVDAKTPEHVQAFVLTWTQPFRVDCMSITTAFATGFNQNFCAVGCKETRISPYYASETDKPYKSFGWRPTMVLAGKNFNEVKKLIDTGISSDFSHPQGSAYLLKTSDQARSSRAIFFPEVADNFKNFWPVNYLEQDYISGREDVMFYFTGLIKVPHINENKFLPGAVADHLTSTGGILSGSNQMNIMDWLSAGATGSYGAVTEPCNFPAKFSNPGILMYFYLRGSSLIEAYWKSVAEPGQGIFIGEPLAKPFAYRTQKN